MISQSGSMSRTATNSTTFASKTLRYRGFTQHPQVASAANPLPMVGREAGHAADVGELQSGFGELLREEGVGHDAPPKKRRPLCASEPEAGVS